MKFQKKKKNFDKIFSKIIFRKNKLQNHAYESITS